MKCATYYYSSHAIFAVEVVEQHDRQYIGLGQLEWEMRRNMEMDEGNTKLKLDWNNRCNPTPNGQRSVQGSQQFLTHLV